MKTYFIGILLLLGTVAQAQHTLSGTVTNKDGEALIGASVQFKNLQLGTITNEMGEFEIRQVSSGNYTIKVSYLGYEPTEKQVSIDGNKTIDFTLKATSFMAEEVIVESTRANEKTPVTFSVVEKEALESKNMGQDLPYMLSMEPSLVTTSDAGAGVGYTGLWIRGSNIQRINVTVNGIPLNDPESHGVFWVNMPDFTSSVNSAQIQRGVGTSTNGGGAFGATINLETNTVKKEAFAEVNSSAGSFNTFKNNVRFGTGLIKGKWAFEGRLSKISSDGYIDRASSDLKSFFVQGGYYTNNTTIKAVAFSGKEETYQAWWGVDEETMESLGRTYNWAGYIYEDDGTERFYDNQVDNYQQDHYQLHISQKVLPNLTFNGALHYTYGRGYYEEYYQNENMVDFGLNNLYFGFDSTQNNGAYNFFYHDTVNQSDMIVRRWLDNHFYGGTYALDYNMGKLNFNFGGAYNKYADAKHFGEIIWAEYASNSQIRDKFYDNVSNKTDFNNYLKINYSPIKGLNFFVDAQLRNVIYTGQGTDKGGTLIDIDENYTFFNPKVGISYQIKDMGMVYGSLAISNREPIRTDFTDAPSGITPEPEKLTDIELGFRNRTKNNFYNANFYYMKYTNQLVLTGEINDVGSPIRSNVGESYRMGLELDGGVKPFDWAQLRANMALSTTNTDYRAQISDTEFDLFNDVQISFSPQVIGGIEAQFHPIKDATITWTTRYVSKQYLDLTENEDRTLDAYNFSNLSLAYSVFPQQMKELQFSLLINNMFNQLYSSNGYMWGTTPYYYPQAGINVLGGVKLKF